MILGWGALQAGSKLRPKVLQHVNVPVIDNNVSKQNSFLKKSDLMTGIYLIFFFSKKRYVKCGIKNEVLI